MQTIKASKIILLVCLGTPCVFGAPPDWLKMAARESLPQYQDAPAVMLRNEQIAMVDDSGEVSTVYRCAYRILRAEGRGFGIVQIPFDSETRVLSIKGWSIPSVGEPYEVGEKDAADTILFTENLYEDTRQKILKIPASEPGAVIGYEYKQRRRAFILQNQWVFQQNVPVRLARFELRLPDGWTYQEFWANHSTVTVQPAGSNRFVWELKEIPEIKAERAMPFWETMAGQLFLRYVAPGKGGSFSSWDEVCQWYGQLVSDRRQPTDELRQKVVELTAGASDTLAKIQALASFVQQEVRYVAIVIGIGSYQPHPAKEVLTNRYGDCKDKVTLLNAMLHQIGVESFYVLTSTNRGMIKPEFSTPLVFDHVIAAIRIPANISKIGLYSNMEHPRMGSLLFFDPTDPHVKLGYLPSELQANDGLLVSTSGGELVTLPLSPASVNSFNRTAKLQLNPDGDLEGNIEENRTGVLAADFRSTWLNSSELERKKTVRSFFGPQTIGVELIDISEKTLDQTGGNSVLNYGFRLGRYAGSAAGLLLLRPRILDQWSTDIMENGERKHPIEYPSASIWNEMMEIALPDRYVVDEIPPPVSANTGVLSYSSKTEVDGSLVRYSRRLEIKNVRMPLEQLGELKKFYRQVAADERARIVLKPR